MHGQEFFLQAFIYLLAAVISVPLAKRAGLGYTEGLAQAKNYARRLKARFAYATNGLRWYGVAVGILTDCVDFELIRKLCAEECVARWTNASQLQLRAVGFDYRAAKGMYGEERCLRGLHY